MRETARRFNPAVAIGTVTAMWLAIMMSVSAAPGTDVQSQSSTAPPASEWFPPPVQSQSPAPAPAGSAASPTTPSPGFAGEDVCLTCHEDKSKGYLGTPHARTANPRSPAAGKGCESCHGPGQAHVDAGGDGKILTPKLMKPAEISEMCISCHNREKHSLWEGSKHDSRNMSCVTCHSIHDSKPETPRLKKESITETCVQCHRKEVNKVYKSSHMPVREGKMECTTCHNPHGAENVKMLREGTSITEACATCHTEKRGPFLFEHTVGRENCVTCHDPHGSNNERMLVAKLPMLCQRCHVHSRHPATIYDSVQVNNRSNRVAGRACVNCHQMVHGSNHPTSGKYFMR